MEKLMLILFPSILITMVETTSIASQDISMQSKCLVNQKKKINRTKSSVQYYSNYTATYRIILSGDIETNPGTGLTNLPELCIYCTSILKRLDFDSIVAYETTILHTNNCHI